jgi:ElaB/YqjD/DUF883 family membrane-anchored ribosome-binding protein
MSSMNTGDKAQRGVQDDLNSLREDLSNLRQDVTSMASDVFGVARESFSGASESMKKKGVEMAETLEEKVHEHPLATVGIAFGVGLLIGALVVRRS